MNTQIKTNTLAFITLALIALGAFAITMPASAFWSHNNSGDDNDIKVSVSNEATVTNTVDVEAKTGGNEADGGDGEEGGNGGDAEGSGDNTGGNGGNGGSGALGGYIVSGDAAAYSSIVNEVNVVKTKITDSCGCDDEEPSMFSFFNRHGSDDGDDNDIRVRVNNSASVANDVEVEAKTGGNEADGGDGEEGGNGGDAEGSRHHRMHSFFSFWSSDDNQGGAGGTGGSGGVGGEIYSGNATSGSEVVNVVNRIVTRITR